MKVASAGFARAIRPVFTPVDGDVMIASTTGTFEVDVATQVLYESLLGDMAAECVADAIRRSSGENL
ncbi:MAG: hypothetical protein KVP17_000214 [Porospora cf. gigantea B]|uniref:uncharacterized protein n=1 Tax=Porospora cf. gigantea B TaxID=2853592 RepID=UPI003571EE48|nr:MAG: hypothetical protein KVP17_000214 [Porospora cf. gigantea B]